MNNKTTRTRDYKPRPKTNKNTKQAQTAPWVWVLTGFIPGAVLALGIYIFKASPSVPNTLPPVISHTAPEPAVNPITKPEPKKNKTQFDFYTILPNLEIMTPEPELDEKPLKPKPPTHHYILQAGSFRRPQDAEQQKANLALIGIASEVQTVNGKKGELWHRVRIGPFISGRELNRVRRKIWDHDMNVMVLKIKTQQKESNQVLKANN